MNIINLPFCGHRALPLVFTRFSSFADSESRLCKLLYEYIHSLNRASMGGVGVKKVRRGGAGGMHIVDWHGIIAADGIRIKYIYGA